MEEHGLLYKELQACLATESDLMWSATSNTGRRLLLPSNQTDLSLWHPGGTSWWDRSRKCSSGRRSEGSWIQCVDEPSLLSPMLWPVWHSCQGSGRLASFIYITDVFVQHGTPLSLPSKFRTWVQACNTSQGLWLWSTNRGLIWCCHPADLPYGWPLAAGQQKRVWALLRLDML